jgi:RNA polymerase sporulation-specific sigma factor
MRHDEIEACVIQAKAGNKEALAKLLEQYRPFIFKMSTHFNIRCCDTNDMLQLGYMAVMKAAAKYRTGSQTFSTYAFNSIKNTFRTAASRNMRFGETLSLNTPVNAENGTNTEFIDCIEGSESPEDKIISFERIKEIRKAVAKLPKEELELIRMVYFSRATLKAYADKNKLDYSQVYRKRNRILKKLSRCINM